MFRTVLDFIIIKPKEGIEVCMCFLYIVDTIIKFYPRDYIKQYNQISDKLVDFKKYSNDNSRLANPIGSYAERIIQTITLESKITGIFLLSYFRFNLPAIDSFILELKESINIKSEYVLSEYPATLLYCISKKDNHTVESILVSNKE